MINLSKSIKLFHINLSRANFLIHMIKRSPKLNSLCLKKTDTKKPVKYAKDVVQKCCVYCM